MILGELGQAADRLAAATHKALALGATLNRDHLAGYELDDDLSTVETANNAVLEHATTFTNLLWRIGHGETGGD